MKQEILNPTTYKNLSNIQRGFFDAHRKSMIMIFDNGSHDFDIEIVQLVEDSAYVFIGELSDETLNPVKYYPVLTVDPMTGTGTVTANEITPTSGKVGLK
jgi:hypothetical protein